MAGKTAPKPKEYRFLIPQIRTLPVGTQGEMASSMPYRLEEGITRESILAELKSQPHLIGVARAVEEGQQVYLLHGRNREQLELAAQYIGTYHRLGCSKWELADWEDGCEEDDEEGEQAGDWQSPAPEGEASFDFSGRRGEGPPGGCAAPPPRCCCAGREATRRPLSIPSRGC